MRFTLASAFALALLFVPGVLRADDEGLPLPTITRTSGLSDIERRVEALRKLSFKSHVPERSVTREELASFYRDLFTLNYGDGTRTETTLKALGLLPVEANFREQYLANKTSSVAGFYLDETVGQFPTGTFYVVPENIGRDPKVLEEVRAHELAHALSDQNHGLLRMHDALPKTATGQVDSDREQALMALEEGTALIIGNRYVNPSWTTKNLNGAASVRRSADYLSARSAFRYTAGSRFVEAVLEKGGFELLDRVYRDPPTSTQQILHPELYLEGRRDPATISLADTSKALPGQWRTVEENVLGAFGANWLTGVSDGLAGDRWRVVQDTATQQVIGQHFTTWDDERQAALFAAKLVERGKIFGLPEGALVHIEQRGRDVLVLTGARPEQVAPLRDALWRSTKSGVTEPATPVVVEGTGNVVFDLLMLATSTRSIAQVTSDAPRLIIEARLSEEGKRKAEEAFAKVPAKVASGDVLDLGGGRYYVPESRTVLAWDGSVLLLAANVGPDVTGLASFTAPSRTRGLAGSVSR